MKLPTLPSSLSSLPLSGPIATIGGVVLMAVLVLLAAMRWGDRLPPALLWAGMAVLLVALLIWLVFRGWPLWRERQFLRQFKQEFGGVAGKADKEPRQDLRVAAEEAMATLNSLDGDAPRRLPWFFVLGDALSARAVLSHATRDGSLPRPDHAAHTDRLWHHWYLAAGVAVEVSDRFICPRTDADTRRLWLHALLTANRLRPQMPLHGLVLMVPADLLLPGADDRRQERVINLRRMIDEILRTLAVDIPVYVVISGIDQLDGAETFLRLLPEATRHQALGHGLADGTPSDTALAGWQPAFEALCTTLYRLQLGLLSATSVPADRQAIHMFPQRVERLREPLAAFLKGLFDTGAVQLQRTARLRGIYLLGGSRQPAFADDLFRSLIPRDATLARSTGGARQRTRRLAVAAAGAALALSALLTAAILWPVAGLETARQQAMQTCLADGKAGSLSRLTDCADSINAFDRIAESQPFGSHRARSDMGALRSIWSVAWKTSVADGLHGAMKQDVDHDFGVRLAVLEELSLLDACTGGQDARCTDAAAAAGEIRARLNLMDAGNDKLQAAHLSYLAWMSKSDRTAERDRLLALRTAGWIATPPTIADLLNWANGLGRPRYVSDFWNRSGEEDSRPLNGAFTAEAWNKGVKPAFDLINRQSANPELATRLTREFHRARQENWAGFLARFGEGASLWALDNAGLKNLLASRTLHPFENLWKELQASVLTTTPDDQLRPWARVMKDAVSNQWPQAAGRMLPVAGGLAQATDSQAGYDLAADAFLAAGSPGAHASQPLWLTLEQFRPLRDQLGADAAQDDHTALDALDAAPRTLLWVAMQDAVARVNEEWRTGILARVRQMPQGQVSTLLEGSQGEVATFVKAWLSPFLTSDALRPRKTMGLEMALDPAFIAFAEQVRQPGTPQGPLPVGTLSVTATTRIGNIMEGPQGTQVEMLCEQNIFTATSPGTAMPRRVNLMRKRGDCREIQVTVSLPADLGQGEPLLIFRSWTGENALEQFARDFAGGRQGFPLSSFNQKGLTAAASQRLREVAGGADAMVTIAADIQLTATRDAEPSNGRAIPSHVLQPVL